MVIPNMCVRKIIQIYFLLFSILCRLNIGRSENDGDVTSHRQRYNHPTTADLGNYIVWQTLEGSRQVTIKSGTTWIQETASWEREEGPLADYVFREITDGLSHVAVVFDGYGRLRECQINQDLNMIEQFIFDIKSGHVLCLQVPVEANHFLLELGNEKEDDSSHVLFTDKFLASWKNTSSGGIQGCRRFSNVTFPPHLLSATSRMIFNCRRFLSSMHSDHNSTTLDLGNPSFSDIHLSGRRRSRRSITYPGTLWCGAGHRAKSEYALGDNTFTDRCCRSHDFCPKEMQILAFKTKHYLTNKNMFTLSHCACDKRFHKCLRQVRNAVSYDVGNWYFNILRSKCFVVRQKKQCVEKEWWGKCKRYEKRPTALLRQAQSFPKSLKMNRSGGLRKKYRKEEP
ncbi:uncharacterized protein LOC121408783 [Lytechinus variegatus]|uniref:uncharacterized protein LOC121408783 n=1 Tax=Lytechinus variegatus TaxID=7654 RepID=UPI001BB135DC|nr:uncharacterized protein LOC121408783 [Lytechinus variegatus]